jgi:hypothetical protein
VEIVSPGAMPVEVDRNEFLAGRATPVWRNQDLAMFCVEQRVAENQGQGVATIFGTMREAGCPPPEFQLGEHHVRCVLRANPRTIRAGLLVGFDASFLPPASLGLSSVVEIPARSSPIDWSRLRSVPIDAPTWEAAMDAIDHGLARVLEESHGDLHVLVMAPYAVAAFLGRRLVDMARARSVYLHQLSPFGEGWDALSRPREAPAQPAEPYFERLLEPIAAPAVSAVLLAIDGAHPIPEGRRDRLAERLGAAAYHLQSRSPEPMHPAQMPGAVVALRQALAVIGRQHPGIPLHIIISAPVALAIELGRQLTAAVFPSAIVHHFDVASAAYVPVLDVVQRKVVSRDLTP